MKRTKNYIATIPFKSEEQVIEVKKVLEQIFGWVTLRGRNKNRKAILGEAWGKYRQNDIPWRQAQYVDVYLHYANPNYNSKTGINRFNLTPSNSVAKAKMLGKVGIGYYDLEKNETKFRKAKYNTKGVKLKPGDWGYIVQELIDFVERNGSVNHTQLHNHYRNITGGSNSFSHCLPNLRKADPNRRCRRYIVKQGKRFCKGNYIVKHII